MVRVIGISYNIEWRPTGEHLKHEDSQRPPIHRGIIVLACNRDSTLQNTYTSIRRERAIPCIERTSQHFWGNVVGSPTEGACLVAWVKALFAHAIVCEFYMSVAVEKNVV